MTRLIAHQQIGTRLQIQGELPRRPGFNSSTSPRARARLFKVREAYAYTALAARLGPPKAAKKRTESERDGCSVSTVHMQVAVAT
jgi:hypothetical protein